MRCLDESAESDREEVDIKASVTQHLKDIAHPLSGRDVTYENAQARERTQVLMDLANQSGGLVIGTGDLSELALGWATYNGDHMSMYGVNAGVPKTLVRHLTGLRGADGAGYKTGRRAAGHTGHARQSGASAPSGKNIRRKRKIWSDRMNCMISFCIISCVSVFRPKRFTGWPRRLLRQICCRGNQNMAEGICATFFCPAV